MLRNTKLYIYVKEKTYNDKNSKNITYLRLKNWKKILQDY